MGLMSCYTHLYKQEDLSKSILLEWPLFCRKPRPWFVCGLTRKTFLCCLTYRRIQDQVVIVLVLGDKTHFPKSSAAGMTILSLVAQLLKVSCFLGPGQQMPKQYKIPLNE